ncbi:hypothetical protein [Parvularcula lutaonensis]|uniref:DUF1850 domain-containing protein n=1 Tax=Parvularcula lutaonensis TaxID=491923 RepID=A0ABV7MDQ2_9PROT|nr:hypothetical protein [Parvularcula lutaonensis]GGY51938.1 hypothetical protein GCM10007148_21110 [Parvularcula lutaonensis]
MLRFLQGIGQSVLLVAGVLSVIYALRPDIRRWVETELVARDAHYYVGIVELRPDGTERWQRIQFYSNRWEIDDKIFDERLRTNDDDAFDVLRALPGETLIAVPDDSYGPMPGRAAAEPLSKIETLALRNQCFQVDEVFCRYRIRDDRGELAFRTDPNCIKTEQVVSDAPNLPHKIPVWVKAVRFTCTGL